MSRRSSRDDNLAPNQSQNSSQTGITFAEPLHSELGQPVPSTSGTGQGQGSPARSIMTGRKSMVNFGDNSNPVYEDPPPPPPPPIVGVAVDNGCNNCSGYLDDSNMNMLKFVTSSKMLDFLFERDNLCNKSEECLKLEREKDTWGSAVDYLLGDKKVRRDRERSDQNSDGYCSDQDNRRIYDPQQCPQQGTSNTYRNPEGTRSNAGICPNVSSVRMVHQNGEPVSKSQADLLCDHALTHSQLLDRLEKISNLCKALPDDPLCSSQHQLRNDSANAAAAMPPSQCRSQSVHNLGQSTSGPNLTEDPYKNCPDRRPSCRSLAPGSSPSRERIGEPPYTLMQGLCRPFNQITVVQADPLIGDLETGILPELVPPSQCPSQQIPTPSAEAIGRPGQSQSSRTASPSRSTRQFAQSTPSGPCVSASTTNQYQPYRDNTQCPSATYVPPQDCKSTSTLPPCIDVGTQQNYRSEPPSRSQSKPDCTPSVSPVLQIAPPPQDCKSTNTLPPQNDIGTQKEAANEKCRPAKEKSNLKWVVTEVTHGTETETTLEMNGQTIKVPTDQNGKGAWMNELQKLNNTGSILKSNLEGLSKIREKSAERGHDGARMKNLQKTTPESITTINIIEEDDCFPETNCQKKVKNIVCRLHDFHPSDNQQSIKGLEVDGQILDPEEEPELELYIKRLEEIEKTLEEIAVDFKDMMKTPSNVYLSIKSKDKLVDKEGGSQTSLPDKDKGTPADKAISSPKENGSPKEISSPRSSKDSPDKNDKESGAPGSSKKSSEKETTSPKESPEKSKTNAVDKAVSSPRNSKDSSDKNKEDAVRGQIGSPSSSEVAIAKNKEKVVDKEIDISSSISSDKSKQKPIDKENGSPTNSSDKEKVVDKAVGSPTNSEDPNSKSKDKVVDKAVESPTSSKDANAKSKEKVVDKAVGSPASSEDVNSKNKKKGVDKEIDNSSVADNLADKSTQKPTDKESLYPKEPPENTEKVVDKAVGSPTPTASEDTIAKNKEELVDKEIGSSPGSSKNTSDKNTKQVVVKAKGSPSSSKVSSGKNLQNSKSNSSIPVKKNDGGGNKKTGGKK